MKERLQKILAARGIASRRRCEEMICAGRVSCNGVIASLGDCADPDTDIILLDGKPIPPPGKSIYILLNKPRGFVTTASDEKGRKCVTELVSDCGYRVYPIGRLDMDSEGLLLFTNDGEFANALMHPSHEVDKTYHVRVKGFTDERLEILKQPIVLDGYQIKPPKIKILEGPCDGTGEAMLCITIHEGRNRQIRRMCANAQMQVLRLKRVSEGDLQLGKLPLGKWRYLTDAEIALLRNEFCNF